MKMKLALFLIAGAALIAMLLLMTSATLRASQVDDRIASSTDGSHVFKTCLKSDAIKTIYDQMTVEVSWSSTKYLTGSLPADAGTRQLAANPKQTDRRIICCGQ